MIKMNDNLAPGTWSEEEYGELRLEEESSSEEWASGAEPFYPINDQKNEMLYKKYRALADGESGVIFGGRLGLYKYLDMDKVVEAALELADRLLG